MLNYLIWFVVTEFLLLNPLKLNQYADSVASLQWAYEVGSKMKEVSSMNMTSTNKNRLNDYENKLTTKIQNKEGNRGDEPHLPGVVIWIVTWLPNSCGNGENDGNP